MLINRKKEILKKIKFILFFLFISILFLYFFIYLERRVLLISNTYHPDSKYYYESFTKTSYLSIYFSLSENIKNFFTNYFSNQLYPSIINIIFEITNFVNKLKIQKFLVSYQ